MLLKMKDRKGDGKVGNDVALDGRELRDGNGKVAVESERSAFLEEEQDIVYHSRYGLE